MHDGTRNSWTLDLPVPRPPLSQNQRLHWAKRHRIAQQLGNDVVTLARAAKLPRHLERVEIILRWQASKRRRRDHDNISPTLKVCCDALVRYGLVVDDDSAHVWSACHVSPDPGRDRVWLEITEARP